LECAWKRASDIEANSFIAWRGRQDLSAKFLNEFLIGAKGFNRWLRLRKKALADDPLESVGSLSTVGRETFKRRPLATDEINRLLINSGPRWVIYLVAIYTGLRRNELKQLQWQDVFLDGDSPRVVLRSETTKNGKSANLPLHPDACRALLKYRGESKKDFGQRIFEGIFPKVPTFHKDLERSGIPHSQADFSGRKSLWSRRNSAHLRSADVIYVHRIVFQPGPFPAGRTSAPGPGKLGRNAEIRPGHQSQQAG